MKIILSREGTDSAAGGIPGIILPNQKIVQVPNLGDEEEKITYGDVSWNESHEKLSDLLESLTSYIYKGKSKTLFSKDIKCHLDPDLSMYVYTRKKLARQFWTDGSCSNCFDEL